MTNYSEKIHSACFSAHLALEKFQLTVLNVLILGYRQRGRSRTSKGSNRSSSLTAYQRSSGKPYAKRPSISPRSSLLRSKLEAEEKNKGTQRVPSQSSASSSQTEHPSDDLSDATAYSDNTQYEVEESSKYSETSELAQALEGFVNDMDELSKFYLPLAQNTRRLTHEFEHQTVNEIGSVVKSAVVRFEKLTKSTRVTRAPLPVRHLSAMRISMGDFLKYLFLLIMVILTGGNST